MYATIQKIEEKYKKPKVVDVRSGDTVRVDQRIKEGAKERTQMFEGLVIRVSNKGSLNYLSYMRNLRGKSARLVGVDFDKASVNDVFVPADDSKEAKQAEAALEEVEKQDPQAEAVQEIKEAKKEETLSVKESKTDNDK